MAIGNSNTITASMILDMAKQMKPLAPFTVYQEPAPVPKYALSKKVQVPDDFRREFDQWLAARFGYQDRLLKPGQVLVSERFGFAVARPEDMMRITTIT